MFAMRLTAMRLTVGDTSGETGGQGDSENCGINKWHLQTRNVLFQAMKTLSQSISFDYSSLDNENVFSGSIESITIKSHVGMHLAHSLGNYQCL